MCLLFLGAVLGLEGVKAVGLYFVGLSAQNNFRVKTHAEGGNTLEMIRATQQPTLTTVSMKSKYNCVFLFGRKTNVPRACSNARRVKPLMQACRTSFDRAIASAVYATMLLPTSTARKSVRP